MYEYDENDKIEFWNYLKKKVILITEFLNATFYKNFIFLKNRSIDIRIIKI